ncbi:hypothetical protein ACFIJ5_13615 [Haloimpatiens sp. FM7330]|uniref:hypothetical protein n=1 Tax=Haloimpatiens sp. FM7330 TaxID=3298610 RepID=UPI0036361197
MEKEILEILKSMQSDMVSMKNDIKSTKEDIKGIKSTQEEHTQILRALEHKTEVISAQQENLKHEVAEIKGEVKSIRKDLSQVEIVTANNWADIAKLKAIK